MLGESQITPFSHPALETLLVCTDGQWFATVRERHAKESTDKTNTITHVDRETFGKLYRDCLMWPLDYLVIEGAKQGCRLKLKAGVVGSAPVYFKAEDDRITVSWNFSDFLTKPLCLDLEVLSHYLALHTLYASRQICVGVNLLTERATLHAEPGKVHYRYPLAAADVAPVARMQAEDALAEFSELLHQAIAARPLASGQIATELSGGMDSATVACAVTALHGPVASLGILLDGPARTAQVGRRQQLIETLGLLDHTVDMDAFPPSLDLQPVHARLERPYGEYYLEAFEALWGSIQKQERSYLFTGIGGDELFPTYIGEELRNQSKYQEEVVTGRQYAEALLTKRAKNTAATLRAFDAPASPVTVSSLLAHVCQAPYLLQRGIWPVNPLSTPHLIAFCHRLPKDIRGGRDIMRRYLKKALNEDVFTPHYTKETFREVLPETIAKNSKRIAAQLQACALSDLGLVDQRAALALLDKVARTQSFTLAAPFATFLWLERFVRQLH